MNKTELIAAVADKTELSKKDAEKAVNGFIEVVTDALKKGEKVQLVGFGNFEVRQRAARSGINPLTKQPTNYPATKVPAFKPGKGLKDSVK
ncbi:HU family DNA-binding protein [Eubacteriales bacterium OttesenSCG-928-N14]|nr:HU family DNA-binding protein [Eubacteriales bacterium OttesenSCG-928-N14]